MDSSLRTSSSIEAPPRVGVVERASTKDSAQSLRRARERFESGDAKGVLVRLRPRWRRSLEFRRHVARSSRGVGRRSIGVGRIPDARRRQPEVDDAGSTVVPDQHVRGLEVAVDDAGEVGGVQAPARRDEVSEDCTCRARPLQPAPKRSSLDELHDEEHREFTFRSDPIHPLVVDSHDVRVGQARKGPGFGLESSLPSTGRHAEDLDRDLAVELGVVCLVHQPVRPGADLVA